MLDLEHMFMHSLVNQPMRIATICLEYLEELLSNVKAADAKGEQYRYDPKCAIDRTAPVFEFLR